MVWYRTIRCEPFSPTGTTTTTGTESSAAPKRMHFWLGRYTSSKMTWLTDALVSLEDNSWTGPIYVLGAGWPDVEREAAASALINALRRNISAKTFILQNAALNAEKRAIIRAVMAENESLTSVTFRNLSDENGERFVVPAELFQHKTIRSISLNKCALDMDACRSLGEAIRHGTSLTTLYLNDVTFDPAGILVFFASMSMSSSLKTLTVKHLHWTSKNTRRFLTILASNKTVESLYIERMALDDEFQKDIAFLVSRNRNIRCLSLRENDIDAIALRHICEEGLSFNKTIEKLYISRNPLGPEGARTMMNLLKKSTSINNVCFAMTTLGVEGCKIVAKELPQCTYLRRVNLDGNQIDGCAEEFLDALQSCYNVHILFDCLHTLLTKGLCPQLAAWKKVDLLLRANKANRRFLSQSEALPYAIVPLVLEGAASQPDVLFTFIQSLGRPLQTTNQSKMVSLARRNSLNYHGVEVPVPQRNKAKLVQRVASSA